MKPLVRLELWFALVHAISEGKADTAYYYTRKLCKEVQSNADQIVRYTFTVWADIPAEWSPRYLGGSAH